VLVWIFGAWLPVAAWAASSLYLARKARRPYGGGTGRERGGEGGLGEAVVREGGYAQALLRREGERV
ncbi:hypothetical protein NSK_008132, partial [Nannochloropsis salina CCMP1776]